MRKLVLLGAGYGNMRILLRLLTKELPDDIEITLVDRTPFHSLKTEFYGLAAGTVSDSVVRVPLPYHDRLKVVGGEIIEIRPDEKCVYLDNGEADRSMMSW